MIQPPNRKHEAVGFELTFPILIDRTGAFYIYSAVCIEIGGNGKTGVDKK